MRPIETQEEALRLVAAGLNDCEIARRLEVPRTTVRDWRKPRYVAAANPRAVPALRRPSRPIVLEPEPYAELLGLYLGDGHITQMARSQRLRLFLDAKYPMIVDEAEAIVRALFPVNRVGRLVAEEGRMVVVWAYSSHLICLFPQHGAGKKHERPIVLEPWQQELVEAAPWAFLRGLHPLGRLRLREPDRSLRVPQLRLREPLAGHPRPLRGDMSERSGFDRAVRRGGSVSTGAKTSPGFSSTSVVKA